MGEVVSRALGALGGMVCSSEGEVWVAGDLVVVGLERKAVQLEVRNNNMNADNAQILRDRAKSSAVSIAEERSQ
jgi:hypothetical protein